jgi:hypothetical protein
VLLPLLVLAVVELTHPAHVSHDIALNFFLIASWWLSAYHPVCSVFPTEWAVWYLTRHNRGFAALMARRGAAAFAGLLGRNALMLSPSAQSNCADAIGALYSGFVIPRKTQSRTDRSLNFPSEVFFNLLSGFSAPNDQ